MLTQQIFGSRRLSEPHHDSSCSVVLSSWFQCEITQKQLGQAAACNHRVIVNDTTAAGVQINPLVILGLFSPLGQTHIHMLLPGFPR